IVLRRLFALFMLVMVTAAQAETVVGQLRDGAVHHESMAIAAVHAANHHGEHGHEDSVDQGADHEHGTPSDHCTHQHGSLFTSERPVLPVAYKFLPGDFPEPQVWIDRQLEPSFRPPQK